MFELNSQDIEIDEAVAAQAAPRRTAARRLFRRGDDGRRPRRPRRGAGRAAGGEGQEPGRNGLRRRHFAGWPGADQQPRRRRRQGTAPDRQRRPHHGGADDRRGPRHRPGAPSRRRRAKPRPGDARRFQDAAARPGGGGDRQSAGLRVDGDRRRHLGAGPEPARPHRAADRGRDPDRRGAQSRQFRRAAGLLARRGDRHQHRGDRGRAGHLLCGRQQHRAIRAERNPAARPGAPRLHRRRRANSGGAAPPCAWWPGSTTPSAP